MSAELILEAKARLTELRVAKPNASFVHFLEAFYVTIEALLNKEAGWKKIKYEHPEIKSKIIIATNLEHDEETRKSIEKDADGYLIKAEITPVELAGFIDQIEI